MKEKRIYNVAIYCRLSKDDGEDKESNSITNQKAFITEYAQKRGWNIIGYYADDGYSGTSFKRPEFERMIKDIEKGYINLVITKDLSRFGRNYITSGYYIEEYFPQHDIRYIAINDNYDSLTGENEDFVPLKNVINEFYAKDISKKVKATRTMMINKGIQIRTSTPFFGYKFNDKGERIIDYKVAYIIQRIFDEYVNKNKSKTQIAKDLQNDKISIASYYFYKEFGRKSYQHNFEIEENRYKWTDSMVSRILTTIEYTGTYITGKVYRISFKIKKLRRHDKTEHHIFENVFEPIIDKDLYQRAQDLMNKYDNVRASNYGIGLRGLCYCTECKGKLQFRAPEKKRNAFLSCSSRRNCSVDIRLSEDYLIKALYYDIKQLKDYILANEEEIIEYSKNYNLLKTNDIDPNNEKQINELKQELNKNEIFVKKLFELYAQDMMPLSIYGEQAKEYNKRIEELNSKIIALEKRKTNIETRDYYEETKSLIKILKETITDDIKTFDREIIKILIKKVEVSQGQVQDYFRMDKQIKLNIVYYYADEIIRGFMYA